MKDYVLKVVNMFPIYIESIGLKLLFSVIVLVVGLKLIDFFIKFISKLGALKILIPLHNLLKSFSAVKSKVVLLTTVVSILGASYISSSVVGIGGTGNRSCFAGGLIKLCRWAYYTYFQAI